MPNPSIQLVVLGVACAASFWFGHRHGGPEIDAHAALARRVDALSARCTSSPPALNEARLLAEVRRTVRDELASRTAVPEAGPAEAAASAEADEVLSEESRPRTTAPRAPDQERALELARRTLEAARVSARWGEAEVVVFRDALARLDAEDTWEVRGEFIRAANEGVFQVDVAVPF